ncbi:MAG: phage terminase large subunit [Candidatus Omnitrophica bacterium]|nr:phage terminase large subunit [Candidatus Omnitrophota bacterium]
MLYGGARGGGKTEAGIVWLTDCVNDPNFRGLVIRKNADDLSDWKDRAYKFYRGLGAKIVGNPGVIKFPSCAIIRLGHLKDDQAYTKYQGHEYHRMLIEELTQIPDEKRYGQLIASCRSVYPELRPQIFSTTNPGGVGHGWVKNRWKLDNVADWGKPFIAEDTKRYRIFIPAKIDDNPTLMKNDPDYLKTLESYKNIDPELYKAWRWGSWDVFSGQVFREFRYELHVTDKFDFNIDECKNIIGFDWGYNAPGCAIWIAIAPENRFGTNHIYIYREIYQNEKTPEDWAKQISVFTKREPTEFMVLPHDCFNRDRTGKRSIADIFKDEIGVRIESGTTLSKGARLNRLAITHDLLAESGDGVPYLRIHPKCQNLIRTLPQLVYDENKLEDVDSSGEDHAYDALSVGLMFISIRYKLNAGAIKNRSLKTEKPRLLIDPKTGEYYDKDFVEEFKKHAKKKKKSWVYK